MSTTQRSTDESAGHRRRPALTLLCVAVITFVAYSILFLATVTRARTMYALDDGVIERGSANLYWFSKDPTVNKAAGVLFSPVLRHLLNCRPYSSFPNEDSFIEWCEDGNDVFVDNVTLIP